MKLSLLFTLLFTLLFLPSSLFAQGFIEHPLRDAMEGVADGSVAFADIDGDNDEDVLIAGRNFLEGSSKLYLNDGNGNFTEKLDIPFEGVGIGSVAFADIDNDGDQDVLLTGGPSVSQGNFDLYFNDGEGNFTLTSQSNFSQIGTSLTSVAFADVDGDNDQDLMVTGKGGINNFTSLLINDGQGVFEEMPGNSFEDLRSGSVAFADIDGDDDLDVLITGINNSNITLTKLYLNNGMGVFTEMMDTSLSNIAYGSVAFTDVDGDNDQDLLITGSGSGSGGRMTKLYINDGQGNFTEIPNTILESVRRSSIAFADVDGDNDQDVLITGEGASNNPVSKLYLNDGLGNFIEMTDHPFEAVKFSFVAFADVDGDGDPDVLITGENSGGETISEVYLNDGQGNFSLKRLNPFLGVAHAEVVFADVDGDNDNDVLLTGLFSPNVTATKLYINDGQSFFTEKIDTPFEEVELGSTAFADVDNDGDKDVLITGETRLNVSISKLYINDGNGNYSELPNTPFLGVKEGDVAFADVDGDNDQDLIITGYNSSTQISSKLYINDGLGNFSEQTNSTFEGVYRSSVAFTDVNGDNNQDLFITGLTLSNNRISKLYINDGLGTFTELPDLTIDGISDGSVAFADLDGDTDQDVLITGWTGGGNSKLYLNDGQGNFIEKPNLTIDRVYNSSIAFADVDGDNDFDLMLTGRMSGNVVEQIAKLYLNDGAANFTELPDGPFQGIGKGSVAVADVDGDNDPDIIVSGINEYISWDEYGTITTKLYLNQFSISPDIEGFCYYDLNENQVRDAGEVPLSNQLIQISPDPTFSYPIEGGNYRFYVDPGTYQVSAIPNENWELTTDENINVFFNNSPLPAINFGFIPTAEIASIVPDIFSAPTRCSFEVPFWLKIQNSGTTNESGYIEFQIPDSVDIISIQPTPDDIIDNIFYWNFADLSIAANLNFYMTLKMPSADNIGDTLNFVATTNLIDINQDTTQNTIYNYNPVLNCAYDPNDKAVIPAGIGNDQLTLFDTELEYRIRFQNTGTDTAFTVRIEDDLDAQLDWNTFRPVSASHPYEVDMDVESGRVTFLFRNILLPDSTTNEPLSHGFVKYKISPLSNLPEGTPITNEASIFFDFNAPIITNRTLNRLVSDLTNTKETSFSTELIVLPNPFHNSTIFRIKKIPRNRGTLNVYDTNGVLVFSQLVISNADVTFRKEGLASGIYFYEVVSDEQERVFKGKVVKF